MGFYRERPVKAVRKARSCCGCGTIIEVGQPALDCAGHYDGDFWADSYHIGCRAAECDMNEIHGAEEWIPLSEIDWEDFPWLIEAHPIVAKRMNITRERYDRIAEEQRRCHEAWRNRVPTR
ncbi:hypothetical protein J3454_14200 [Erythrobacter sp. NFXS35]|uniref:hypothetical protein n=1 Tax=Erythrobacter sp. NFXS35 TaxID=2818436 RepID=UPI0032DEC389